MEFFPAGYPRQAAFADGDENFMIYRRFGYIHSRLLLNKQDELRELEDNLNDIDKRDERTTNGKRYLASRELGEEREVSEREARTSLLKSIEEKALQYGF